MLSLQPLLSFLFSWCRFSRSSSPFWDSGKQDVMPCSPNLCLICAPFFVVMIQRKSGLNRVRLAAYERKTNNVCLCFVRSVQVPRTMAHCCVCVATLCLVQMIDFPHGELVSFSRVLLSSLFTCCAPFPRV